MEKMILHNAALSETARLADRRLRICLDLCPTAPWADCDFVFNPSSRESGFVPMYDPLSSGDKVIATKTLILGDKKVSFYTTAERVKELCGNDPSFLTPEGLETKCWGPEKADILNWDRGFTFGVVDEVWNAEQRIWVQKDSTWNVIGIDALKDCINDMIAGQLMGTYDCVCADPEVIERIGEDKNADRIQI